jgi:ankyrin repeat protein
VTTSANPLVSQLFAAIEAGRVEDVEQLLDANPSLVSARSPDGQTPMHAAAQANHPPIVRLLLARGADPHTTYASSAHDALSWALTTGAVDAARTLVESGVVPDLFCAAGLGELQTVRACFNAEGRVRAGASRTGSSRFDANGSRLPAPPTDAREIVSDALYFASRNGQPLVVQFLLTCGPDLGFRAFLGGTPLHWAWYGATPSVIRLLLEAGADPTLRDDEFRCTPRAFGICVAANWGLTDFVKRLLQLDPRLATIHEGRGTPLHEAARAGALAIIRVLVAAGADPHVRDADHLTPRDLAQRAGHHEAAALLTSGHD